MAAGFYAYGHFALQIWHTPLVIALGWAVIGFSAMWFSDSLNLPEWVKPFLDALFALLIDLSMDTIAIRDSYSSGGETLSMWNWGIPLDAEWFGVPYANLIGWWAIVFLMSSALRLGRYVSKWQAKKWLWLSYPLLSLLTALLVFLVLLMSFAGAFGWGLFILLLGLSLAVVAINFKGVQKTLSLRKDAPVFIIPLVFHGFFLTLLLSRGMQRDAPYLLLVALSVFVLHETMLLLPSRIHK